MDQILEIQAKLTPILRHYPKWARTLFAATFIAVIASLTVFILLYSPASQFQRLGLDVDLNAPTPNPNDPLLAHQDSNMAISYQAMNSPKELLISPKVGYLDLLAKGGPIQPISYEYTPFGVALPNLDLKVVNNSQQTYFFTEAIFDVDESTPDLGPVLLLPADDSGMNALHIAVVNDGWGTVLTPKLRISVTAPTSSNNSYPWSARNLRWSAPKDFPFATFSTDANVDISGLVASAGANLQRLTELQETESSEGPSGTEITTVGKGGRAEIFHGQVAYDREVQSALGPFRFNAALVRGELDYKTDAAGPEQKLLIQTIVGVNREERAGAPAPPSYQYSVLLRPSGSNYSVTVPISQVVKPGDADRFDIFVAASQSSIHRLRVRLKYNGSQEMDSEPINLTLFMPRSVEGLLEKQEIPTKH